MRRGARLENGCQRAARVSIAVKEDTRATGIWFADYLLTVEGRLVNHYDVVSEAWEG
jgi:hypothetical protein